MGTGMADAVKEESIRDLTVEPDVLVQRQKLDLGSNESHDCPTHGEKDDHRINAQN